MDEEKAFRLLQTAAELGHSDAAECVWYLEQAYAGQFFPGVSKGLCGKRGSMLSGEAFGSGFCAIADNRPGGSSAIAPSLRGPREFPSPGLCVKHHYIGPVTPPVPEPVPGWHLHLSINHHRKPIGGVTFGRHSQVFPHFLQIDMQKRCSMLAAWNLSGGHKKKGFTRILPCILPTRACCLHAFVDWFMRVCMWRVSMASV